jgi:hypothetical protein
MMKQTAFVFDRNYVKRRFEGNDLLTDAKERRYFTLFYSIH